MTWLLLRPRRSKRTLHKHVVIIWIELAPKRLGEIAPKQLKRVSETCPGQVEKMVQSILRFKAHTYNTHSAEE